MKTHKLLFFNEKTYDLWCVFVCGVVFGMIKPKISLSLSLSWFSYNSFFRFLSSSSTSTFYYSVLVDYNDLSSFFSLSLSGFSSPSYTFSRCVFVDGISVFRVCVCVCVLYEYRFFFRPTFLLAVYFNTTM